MRRLFRGLWWLLTWLLVGPGFGADGISKTETRVVAEPLPLALEPVYRLKAMEGNQRLVTRREAGFEKLQVEGVAFGAVCTNPWPAGLVPVFGHQESNRFELRRRPEEGQENSSEPLFFALPPEDEPEASKLAGRWQCTGVRGDGSTVFLGWEFAIEGEKISGRFDQNTDSRFANISEGLFRSNRFELRVVYINDVYLLTGDWRDGKMTGKWRRADDEERGTWEASREASRGPASKDVVPLYEWRRAGDDGRCYALAGDRMGAEWKRAGRPICRVWRGTP